MHLIATEHDEAGRPIARETVHHEDAAITEAQLAHLRMGLEVVIIRAGRRIDLRPVDQPTRGQRP